MEYELHDQETFAIGVVQDFATQSFLLKDVVDGKVSFSLDGVQKEQGAYKVILSLPGVRAHDEQPAFYRARITFIRDTPVLGEIKWFIKGLWKRRP